MIKVLKKLATNKKGSEIVEKIFMVVASVALAAIAVAFIASKIKEVSSATVDEDGQVSTTTESE